MLPDPTNSPHTQPIPEMAQANMDNASTTQLTSAFGLYRLSIKAWGVNISTIVMLTLIACIPIIGLLAVFVTQFGLRNINLDTSSLHTAVNIFSLVIGILCLISIIVLCLLMPIAYTKIQLCSVRCEKISISDALKCGRQYWAKFLGLILLVGLLIIGGLILFIVPGVFMYRRYLLSPYYLLDKDLGIREAMRESAADSKKGIWGIVGVMFLANIVQLIPVIGAIISLFASVLYYFAPAVRYKEIQDIHQSTGIQLPPPQPLPAQANNSVLPQAPPVISPSL